MLTDGEGFRLFLEFACSEILLPFVPDFRSLYFVASLLFVEEVVEVLTLEGEGFDIFSDEVDAGTVDNVVSVTIAGDAFVKILSVFFDEFLL